MGRYLNSNADGFGKIVNSEIYVDKTGMLSYTNQVLNTMQGYLCVSRPRRFGKSTAANMLTAYYSCGCDSKALFSGFKIAKDKDFEKYLNHYNTISLNMQEFLSMTHSMDEMLTMLQKYLVRKGTLIAEQSSRADLNADHVLNVVDAMLLRQLLLKQA